MSRLGILAALLLVLALGIGLGAAGMKALEAQVPRTDEAPRPGEASQPATIQPMRQRPAVLSEEATVAEVYERVSPSVVNITATARARDLFGRRREAEATGSGFIIDPQGHIVTNYHVTADAQRLDVTLADNTTYLADVVASDPATDLAVLRLQAPQEKLQQLTVATLGDSDSLRVGQTVVAIGNPFGLERSATVGIVSSLGRVRRGTDRRLITNMIQTDAAINPGNSGGPLLNLRGEVVGINEQIQTTIGVNVGIGFAIPVNTLKRDLPDLLAGREPLHAWLGIGGERVVPSVAEQLRLTVQQGVYLVSVVTNGPAARAGLRQGDVITEIDGNPMRSIEDVATYIDRFKPGHVVRVSYVRDGASAQVDVSLGAWDPRATPTR